MVHVFITVVLLLVIGQVVAGRAAYLALRSDPHAPAYRWAAPVAALFYVASALELAEALALCAYT